MYRVTISIPLWILFIIVVLIVGAVVFIRIGNAGGGGAYDFFTPLALLAVAFITIAIIVGVLIGKFIF